MRDAPGVLFLVEAQGICGPAGSQFSLYDSSVLPNLNAQPFDQENGERK